MLENVLLLVFAGLGALIVVLDSEQRANAPWIKSDRPASEEHQPVHSAR
jgi:hypothetical protein